MKSYEQEPFASTRLLRAQFGKGEPAAPASSSRGPGNGILRAETGGLFQAHNAGEQSEFGSQTTLRLTNPPELQGFCLPETAPVCRTAWWDAVAPTGLRDRARLGIGKSVPRWLIMPSFRVQKQRLRGRVCLYVHAPFEVMENAIRRG